MTCFSLHLLYLSKRFVFSLFYPLSLQNRRLRFETRMNSKMPQSSLGAGCLEVDTSVFCNVRDGPLKSPSLHGEKVHVSTGCALNAAISPLLDRQVSSWTGCERIPITLVHTSDSVFCCRHLPTGLKLRKTVEPIVRSHPLSCSRQHPGSRTTARYQFVGVGIAESNMLNNSDGCLYAYIA